MWLWHWQRYYLITFGKNKIDMIKWWKIVSALLILYTLVWGMLGPVPRLDILNETIRNVYYHVPIWFAMLFQM